MRQADANVANAEFIVTACNAYYDHVAQIATLEDEVKRLREALEPFADVAECDIGDDETDAELFRPMTQHNRAPRLTVGNIRAARAALQQEGE